MTIVAVIADTLSSSSRLPLLLLPPRTVIVGSRSEADARANADAQKTATKHIGGGGGESGFGLGVLFLAFSLLMDGLTGPQQERMKMRFRTSSDHMMLYLNLWSIVLLLAGAQRGGEEGKGRCGLADGQLMRGATRSAQASS